MWGFAREPGCGQGLAGEPLADVRVLGVALREHLHGHGAAERRVGRPEDLAHAARPIGCAPRVPLRQWLRADRTGRGYRRKEERQKPPTTAKYALLAWIFRCVAHSLSSPSPAALAVAAARRGRGLGLQRHLFHRSRRLRRPLPLQRPRLGPRRRDEPVGRVRLRAARRDVRADPRPLLPGHDARAGERLEIRVLLADGRRS